MPSPNDSITAWPIGAKGVGWGSPGLFSRETIDDCIPETRVRVSHRTGIYKRTPGHASWSQPEGARATGTLHRDRKSTRLNSSHSQISYAVFCLKKKKKKLDTNTQVSNNKHKVKKQVNK